MEVQGAEPPRNFGSLTSGGQVNSWKYKKPSKLIYFECKFNVIMFLYPLKQNVMKIEFEHSIRRLSFLCHLLDIKITNIWGFPSNFIESETFVESNLPDVLAPYETNLDDSIDSEKFSVRGYLPLIRNDSVTHMDGLTVYLKDGKHIILDWNSEIVCFFCRFP